tara:strand:+ start:15954 stop:16181 length:228 start_codon:yes stop_codon:yes gene_type:complete
MIKTFRLMMQYKEAIPLALDLIQETEKSMRDDGSISKEERSILLKKFWAIVRVLQAPKKEEARKKKLLSNNKLPS